MQALKPGNHQVDEYIFIFVSDKKSSTETSHEQATVSVIQLAI